MPLTLSETRFVEAFKAFVHREGCSPSLGDVRRAFGFRITVGRVRDLRNQLVRKGVLTYVPGETRSMRLVAAVENLSDAEVLRRHALFADELQRRGLNERMAEVGAALRSAVPVEGYTNLGCENPPEMSDLLRQLDGGGTGGEAGEDQGDVSGAPCGEAGSRAA